MCIAKWGNAFKLDDWQRFQFFFKIRIQYFKFIKFTNIYELLQTTRKRNRDFDERVCANSSYLTCAKLACQYKANWFFNMTIDSDMNRSFFFLSL